MGLTKGGQYSFEQKLQNTVSSNMWCCTAPKMDSMSTISIYEWSEQDAKEYRLDIMPELDEILRRCGNGIEVDILCCY